jgi:hypothetical protein
MTANKYIHGMHAEYCRIDNDNNGNPRYVIHWLSLGDSYEGAVQFARKFGGQKYRAKWYGGGIVFQSYNIEGLILDMTKARGQS